MSAPVVNAAVETLPAPTPSGYADTESTVVVSLASWGVYNPPVKLTLETNGTATNAVQVAFGHDLNGDGDLAPEETERVIGYDCGSWFIRDERAIEELFFLANQTPAGSSQPTTVVRQLSNNRQQLTTNFRLAKNPAERWDLAKVTTRGRADSAATIVAQLLKPHFYIIVK